MTARDRGRVRPPGHPGQHALPRPDRDAAAGRAHGRPAVRRPAGSCTSRWAGSARPRRSAKAALFLASDDSSFMTGAVARRRRRHHRRLRHPRVASADRWQPLDVDTPDASRIDRRRDRHRRRRVPRPAGPAHGQAGDRPLLPRPRARTGAGAADGIEACNYLLAVDVDMTPLPGYRLRELGAGLRRLQPPCPTSRRCGRVPWLEKTALVLCDLVDEETGEPVEVSPRQILRTPGRAGRGRWLHGEVRVRARVLPVPRLVRGGGGEGLRTTSRRTRL